MANQIPCLVRVLLAAALASGFGLGCSGSGSSTTPSAASSTSGGGSSADNRSAFQVFCDAPVECAECNLHPLGERAVYYYQWTAARVGEERVADLAPIALLHWDQRGPWLREEAREDGHTACAMADYYDRMAGYYSQGTTGPAE